MTGETRMALGKCYFPSGMILTSSSLKLLCAILYLSLLSWLQHVILNRKQILMLLRQKKTLLQSLDTLPKLPWEYLVVTAGLQVVILQHYICRLKKHRLQATLFTTGQKKTVTQVHCKVPYKTVY